MPPRQRKRRWRPRLALAHVVMIIAGLAAFLLVLHILSDREQVISVAVASHDVAAGVPLADVAVEFVDARGGSDELVSRVATAEWIESEGRDLTFVSDVAAGSLINRVSLGTTPGPRLRSMSVAVDMSNAAGGELGIGDTADVLAVLDGRASVVIAGAKILSVDAGAGALASDQIVTLGVDLHESLRLAHAMSQAELRIVRATGAPAAAENAAYPVTDGGAGES